MTLPFDFIEFFNACDPSHTLVMSDPADVRYYIDFASVRGGKVIESMKRTIVLKKPDQYTCQLFTGHIGCGKSTELRRLQTELEQQGFHVVYIESDQDLNMEDVDVTDILLAMMHQIVHSLEEEAKVKIQPGYFRSLFQEIAQTLQSPVEIGAEFSFPLGLGQITAKTKESPQARSRLRSFLEPRTDGLLKSLNEDVLIKGTEALKAKGKKGLVVIVDSLDRVGDRLKPGGRSQIEYLFVDRGEQLRRLQYHLVYTIPLKLVFSNDYQTLMNRMGGGVDAKILPMVPIHSRRGERNEMGMALLRDLVLARAFPESPKGDRPRGLDQLFDDPSTLDRLCEFSGGHVRNLLGLLSGCLQEEDPPINRPCLEGVIRRYRDNLALAVTDDEWEMLQRIARTQSVSGEDNYTVLLRSLFVFEYQDNQGRWFNVNPGLLETDRLAGASLL
jgi:hypothetical protein